MENRKHKRRRRQEPVKQSAGEDVTDSPAETTPMADSEENHLVPADEPHPEAAPLPGEEIPPGYIEADASGEPPLEEEATWIEPTAYDDEASAAADESAVETPSGLAPGGFRRHGANNEQQEQTKFARRLHRFQQFRIPLPISLMDRYILENFFTPLFIIFIAVTGIGIIFDLQNNLESILRAKVSAVDFLLFYGTQLPGFAVPALQVSLLLAVLYCLSRLSRTHELVAMLSAGRSVPRLLVPILLIGLVASLICVALSYQIAPWAAAEKEAQLQALTRGEKREAVLFGQLYRNRQDRRTWHVRRMPLSGNKLNRVHILQQDEQGGTIYTIVAKDIEYDYATMEWKMDSVRMDFYDAEGNVTPFQYRRYMDVRGWRETPQLIASSYQNPELMGVPALRQYLRDNADFPDAQLAPFRTYLHHRWAAPWIAMVVVLFGAPLGMAFSRAGIVSNVATAIFLFIGLLLGQEVFMALGKGGRLDPWLAAWLPNIVLAIFGIYLLCLRSANRDLPKLNLFGLYTALTTLRPPKASAQKAPR